RVRRGRGGLGAGGKKMNGIPDAQRKNESKSQSQNCHRDPPDDASLQTGRIRVNLRRDADAMTGLTCRKMNHRARGYLYRLGSLDFGPHWYELDVLDRQVVAEPAHGAAQGPEKPKDANRPGWGHS